MKKYVMSCKKNDGGIDNEWLGNHLNCSVVNILKSNLGMFGCLMEPWLYMDRLVQHLIRCSSLLFNPNVT